MGARNKPVGPSVEFLKLKRDLDLARRELSQLKKSLGLDPQGRAATDAAPAAASGAAAEAGAAAAVLRLKARAFTGLGEEACATLEAEDVALDDFTSWLKDEFKVSRSYFISHKASFNRILPRGYVADLGRREEWEWHENDVLLVPLNNR